MKLAMILIFALTFIPRPAQATSLLGLVKVNDRAVKYIKDRAKETRVGYTVSFDGTQGGSVYLPIRWTKKGPRLIEGGIGYHHQEAGTQKVFLYGGTDLQVLYRQTVKKWFDLGSTLDGPPLFPIYISTWVNAYTGKTWVIGAETGIQGSVELLKF